MDEVVAAGPDEEKHMLLRRWTPNANGRVENVCCLRGVVFHC